MTWNYRVFRWLYEGEGYQFTIAEAHYDKPGDEIPKGWASPIESPSYPMGDSIESLRWTISEMTRALEKPVLDAHTGQPLTEEELAASAEE